MKALVGLVLSLVLFAPPALAGEAPPDHSFTAQQADPAGVYSPNRDNIAVTDPSLAGNGLLLVFLSGTGAKPQMYDTLLRAAVEDGGFHALGLDWANGFDTSGDKGDNIFGPCGDDTTCYAAARQEAFDGIDATPKVSIGKTDAILNRLIKALTYLNATYPSEGWGAFLDNGQPAWTKIVLAGHSNGSGEAAYIASKIPVARVALFSGPADSTGTRPSFTAAPWMTAKLATPAAVWYAFGSKNDNQGQLDRFDRYRVNWPALGLGASKVVDGATAPFGGAHALVTDLDPCAGCTAHNMTAANKTPMQAGVPLFRPVWDYMLGAVTPVAAVTPAAAAPAGDVTSAVTADLPTPQIVHYESNGQNLKAFLYLPPGSGPFPVYLWNHGSEQDPSFDKRLAQFWMGEGFAFFKPIRSGHGGNPGDYIVDQEKAVFAKQKAGTLSRAAANAAILALHEKANEDVVNAYKWLITQPFADTSKIVVAGGSYGGIQTVLTAEANAKQKLGIAAFVAMSPAAKSWRPAWAANLSVAIKAASGPIFLAQAHNDYNLGPTEVLGPIVDARGAPSQCLLFPDHLGGAVQNPDDPHAQGHAGFFADPTEWGASVIAYLEAVGVVTRAPMPATSPLGLPVKCSAKE